VERNIKPSEVDKIYTILDTLKTNGISKKILIDILHARTHVGKKILGKILDALANLEQEVIRNKRNE